MSDPNHTTAPRKILLLLIIISLLVGLILALLPYGIRYGILRRLSDTGAKGVSLRDVDFNPFTGNLVLHGLTIQGEKGTPLTLPEGGVTVDWRPLLHREIRIEEVTLRDTEILLEEGEDGRIVAGGISLSVKAPAIREGGGEPWSFTLEKLRLNHLRVRLKMAGLNGNLEIDEADLTGLSKGLSKKPARLALKGRLNGAPLNLQSDLAPFAAKPVYSGKVSLREFGLSALNPLLPGEKRIGGQLTFDITFTAAPKEPVQFSIQGVSTGKKIRFDNGEGKRTFFAAERVHLEGIDVAGKDRAAFEKIEGESILIGEEEKGRPPVRLDRITLNGAGFDAPRSFFCSTAGLSGLDVFLHRSRTGKFREIEALLSSFDTKEPQPEESPPAPRVRAEKVMITGSSVTFHDDAVEPPFHSTLTIESLHLSGIDSTKAGAPSPVTLQGKVGKYTVVKITGNLQPFAPKTTFRLSGDLRGLDLPPLSSYTGDNLGYNLVSGLMDGVFDVKAAKGKIDGEGRLTLNNLEVTPKNEKKMEKLAAQLTMPLDGALSMLRDKKNDIRLALPVSGDIDDPKFDLSDAVNQALGKALKTTAVSFLKYTLQPYGAILAVAQLAGKAVTAVRLDPVLFSPGSAIPEASAAPYFDKVAKLMEERPEIRIKLCGKATPADRITAGEEGRDKMNLPVDDPAPLLALAKQRASALKDYLVTRKGIAPDRLFLCNPEIDTAEGALQRVELLI